jgi:hypothetical protein
LKSSSSSYTNKVKIAPSLLTLLQGQGGGSGSCGSVSKSDDRSALQQIMTALFDHGKAGMGMGMGPVTAADVAKELKVKTN